MSDEFKNKPEISRRKFIKAGSAATVAASVGPWVISSKALASSGEINVLMWSDYLSAGFIKAFEATSGIKINFTGVGSNEEIIKKMKASEGGGIDICSPTNFRSPQWKDLGLLQSFDLSKIKNIKKVNPAMLRIGEEEWNFEGEGSHWLPLMWGTEGIAWRTDKWTPPRDGGIPSYGDIWQVDVKGKTMMRPHSGMLGAGLYLETIGKLEPGAMKKAYNSEAEMHETWRVVTDFCVANKKQVKLFWNDADSQKRGLLDNGVIVGQTWDGPPITMMNDNDPVQYRAPLEGALAWVDGMALSTQAQNLDAIYEFLDYCYQPEVAGRSIDGGKDDSWGGTGHGYNSAVLGADKFASDKYAKVFKSVYPGKSLGNLWPWPKEPQWYADLRTGYVKKFQAA